MVNRIASMTLSRLPLLFLQNEYLSVVSSDCQIYLQCSHCSAEQRLSPLGFKHLKKSLKRKCNNCGKKKFRVVRHLAHAGIRCSDCHAEYEAVLAPWENSRCKVCLSQNLEESDIGVDPPFPTSFGELNGHALSIIKSGDEVHLWGVSGEKDAKRIMDESRYTSMLPERHRYLYALIIFCHRLIEISEYSTWEDRYWMSNISGNLCQNYFRQTGYVDIGLTALADFSDMILQAPDDANRAIAQHSFAMGVFSLLARYGEDSISEMAGQPDLRADAIAAAESAERIFKEMSGQDIQGVGQQIARIHYILGDLLRIGNSNDEQRRRAITYFNLALQEPWVTQRLGFAISESRASAVLELADPGEDLLVQAVQDLQAASSAKGSDDAYHGRWRSHFLLSRFLWRHGDNQGALMEILRAASLALQRFQAYGDEFLMLFQAEQLVEVFEFFALQNANVGWNDEALGSVEITRAASIRLYTMGGEERDALFKELRLRQMEDLWPSIMKDNGIPPLSGQVSDRNIEDYFEENPIGTPMLTVLKHSKNLSTVFVSLFISEGIAVALICSMADSEHWKNDRMLWRPDEKQIDWLRQRCFIEPGPFRERQLIRACSLAHEALLKPVLDFIKNLKVTKLVLSVPGIFSQLPFEAFLAEDGTFVFDRIDSITYVPSVRLGADLINRSAKKVEDHRQARVLLIGYDGEDMPKQPEEVACLQGIWQDRLTYLPGTDCTKRRVLEEMAEPYDIIHILCHATFDEGYPLNSFLQFCADRGNDSRRVTALDLLLQVQLKNSPLIILSACSSVITADSRTNSFHGLPGSLFRIGARAIIGSRWPVHDEAAAHFMSGFHNLLKTSSESPNHSLHKMQHQMRDAGWALEDWSAFGFFGIN